MEERVLIILLSQFMIVCGIGTLIALKIGFKALYGRYTTNSGWLIEPKLAWMIQECPSFIIPTYYLIFHCRSVYTAILLLFFIVHYFHRSFVFPRKLRSPNGTPWYIVLSAFIFCTWNGFIQGAYLAKYQAPLTNLGFYGYVTFVIGSAMYFIGSKINRDSDEILTNLRAEPSKDGERYKIPYGKMFEYVSCPNFFGEIVEWAGFAIASQNWPATAFAFFTASNIGPRALQHHQFYLEKFKEKYPKDRKALIPFIL